MDASTVSSGTVDAPAVGTPQRAAWRARRLIELRTEIEALLREEHGTCVNPPLEALRARCRVLKIARRPIEAIKLYRQETGCGLREAHDFVQGL